MFTAPYEETYSVPPIVDAEDLWRLAHQLSMQVASSFVTKFLICPISVSKIHYSYTPLQHNTAKSTRQPLQKLRMYSKMFSAPGGGDAAFRYVGNFICV